MALRAFIKVRNLNCQLFRSSSVLSSAVNKNYSVLFKKTNNLNRSNVRMKYEKKSNISRDAEDEDSDDETEGMSDVDKKTVIKVNLQSMRADLLLKSGVGIARNKIEAAFYEGRIRINGKKLMKKAQSCNIGDVIDYIKNDSPTNPNHSIISRVEIMSATPKEDIISVTMKRFKSLTVEKKE